VNELPNADAWLSHGIAVITASIRIPATSTGKIIIAIGLYTISSAYKCVPFPVLLLSCAFPVLLLW
jgi:hypothetical protein